MRAIDVTVTLLAGLATCAAVNPYLMGLRSKHMQRLHGEHAAASVRLPPDQWYNQTLDHFDATNMGWWNQRYWVNTTFWRSGSSAPVFFYVEGEGAGSPLDVVQGQHVELAALYGGLIVALEHRYYGASIPVPDLTLDNMKYLSSHQAIGDIARFIAEFLVPTYGLTPANRIITFGGSYPGALSAWVRLRLPHLVFAAFSTSSPVQAQLDFTGYNDVIAASMNTSAVGGSSACLSALQQAFVVIDTALRGTPTQQQAISKQLYSCAAPQTLDDVKNMANNLAGVIMGVVQYNDDQVGGMDIASMCKTFTSSGLTPINAFAQIVQQSLGGQPCMDNSYADFIAQVGNTTADPSASGVGMRQWTYQTCTQFGYYQTCEAGTNCPFTTLMDLPAQIKICQDAFGAALNGFYNGDRVAFTNDYLGAKNVATSRVLFTNGLIDPWHMLSVLPSQNNNATNAALVIPTGAHCRQMFPSSPNDPADVKAARAAAANILGGWLANNS